MIQQSPNLPASGLFERFVERGQTPMPPDYVPSAKGVLIAGDDMLLAAGHRARSHSPKGWCKVTPGVFMKATIPDLYNLQVRQFGNWQSQMWAIERTGYPDTGFCEEALVCAFEDAPIWATTYQGAMRIAEYCHPFLQGPVPGYWAKAWR